jgi:hypothetical protein
MHEANTKAAAWNGQADHLILYLQWEQAGLGPLLRTRTAPRNLETRVAGALRASTIHVAWSTCKSHVFVEMRAVTIRWQHSLASAILDTAWYRVQQSVECIRANVAHA